IMDDDLMFSMEEEGSAQRPSAQRNGFKKRPSSLSDANASDDDDDEDHFISPILGDSVKEVCNYLKDLAYTRQLSNSLPKSNFLYRAAWIKAIEKARALPDPWAQFHLEEIETEPCVRYRYERLPFGKGAMRECFRAKKLSNFSHSSNWKSASNYVAKRYMETVDREVYFEDVRLQMEAKLWGEEYNRHRPPKQVEGKTLREKATSHRARTDFENILLVFRSIFAVQEQSVGPIHTSVHPQIHPFVISTSMSHPLPCIHLSVHPSKSAKTVLRGCEEVCGSPRVRTWSTGRGPPLLSRLSEPSSADESMSDVDSIPCSPLTLPFSPIMAPGSMGKSPSGTFLKLLFFFFLPPARDSESGGDSGYPSERRSEGDPNDHVDGLTDEKWSFFHSSRAHVHRPSCVATEVERLNALLQKKIGQSILGKVHLAMVRYHEAGRFCEKDEQWDQDSAMFHLERAALCGELEAIVALGKCYLQLPHHILPDMEVEDNAGNRMKGFKYLLQAAEAGDRSSMIIVARAFDNGFSLSADRSQDWEEAIHWYDSALNMTDYDEGGEFDGTQDEPRYLLLAREAEMYQEGGFNLTADPQKAGDLFTEAAEAATAAMKGRLANQYYMKAEEAWALVEE
uniref:Eukaryotic elongation factor 2 kinase n=1 Tax=Fundulus heteroclitus TaxID=8078 RepID=A0A3Q2QKM8_FUNHE